MLQLIIANCCQRCVMQIYDGADMFDIQCAIHHRTVHRVCGRDSILDGISSVVVMSLSVCELLLSLRGRGVCGR